MSSKGYTTTTVKQMLDRKGNAIWSIDHEASVYDALALMKKKSVGALIVLENGQVVGIFSERDYARRVKLEGKLETKTPVRDVMTRNVICVNPDQTIAECMALMTGKFIRHLPVMNNDQLIGVLSIGDIVKEVIAEQEFVINQLVKYIEGEKPIPPISK